MNSYTNKSDFLEDAQFILDNSDLLNKEDCVIIDDVLYEQILDEHEKTCYRFFFSCDDYDYVEDNDEIISRIETELSKR